MKQEKKVEVLILDKTIKNDSTREHKGLVWALNHEKIKKTDGQSYKHSTDFVKQVPDIKGQSKEDLPDYLYIADSYGIETVNKQGKPEVKGGLTTKDVQHIRKLLFKGQTKLIAEFNAFATPTSKEAREEISDLLNVKWTGWIGRQFQDLSDEEVPAWIKSNYEQRNGKKWTMKGSGLLFIHENGEIIVLRDKDIKEKGVQFSFNAKSKQHFGLEGSVPYHYWFDIIEPANKNETIAEYTLSLTSSGKDKLKHYGLTEKFPAIINHRNVKYESYYFAGDYADREELPDLYQTWGISWIKEKFMLDDGHGSSFYWKVYLPLLKAVLDKKDTATKEKESVEIHKENEIHVNARAKGDYLQVMKNGKWENFLIKGVNMGIAKPGTFPGETAITKDEYYRWFKQIGGMNANAIRVYTIHPPAFYEAFYEYNQTAAEPLFLFHGVWVNEDELKKKQDVYSSEVSETFKNEIQNVVDIINGQATIEKKAGHAGGQYNHNISKYLLGYILGVEWDPEVVANTNEKHDRTADYKGTYFSASAASPFENWLAGMMDYTTKYETETYQWQHAVSHVNWVTTDILKHPAEPFDKEDMVSVNPNVIKPKNTFKSGYFASYHIYPYYPDFLNYEKKYLDYIDHRGEKNNYAGYLNDMKQVHSMPLLVAEFGVPSSRGITHENVYGLDQGHHSEKEQGNMDTRLFEDIVQEKMAGGMVFTWQDEWFKRTWNTMDFDNPDRRPFWSNAQTNEQQFGLLSFDPAGKSIKVDGMKDDWNGEKPLYQSNSGKNLKSVFAASDTRYFYMRIDYKHPVKKENLQTGILLDTLPGQGQMNSPDGAIHADTGAEFSINLSNDKDSRVLVDSYYDSFYYMYGHELKMIPEKDYASVKNNGVYHPLLMALNKELVIPDTKEVIPFQSFETGKLQFGNGNPFSESYNSLSDVSVNEKEGTLEIRIPWLLLGVKDPSLHEVTGNLWSDGLAASVRSEGIRAAVYTTDQQGALMDALPKAKSGILPLKEGINYMWGEWDKPLFEERLKQSYFKLQKTFKNININEE
ncbi:hypothetical protein ACFFJY_10120 [Fictibacillus aquaticus]|uniref:hypothetical protein n=1 Tax=Fictibacillus aquaticus TaxID=2021314 RepID=UPI003084409D